MPIKTRVLLFSLAVSVIPIFFFSALINNHIQNMYTMLSQTFAESSPEIFSAIAVFNRQLIVFDLVSLLLVAIITPFVSHSITSQITRIERNYAQKAAELAQKIDEEKKKEAKEEAMLSSIGEGIVVTDKSGLVEYINPPAESMMGWKQEEVVGKKWYEIAPLIDESGTEIPPEKRATQMVLQTGQPRSNASYYYIKRDKTKFPVGTTAAPVKLGGETIGVIAVFRDITKEKNIDKAKSEFVSLASHQLRTPLSAIKWFAEMLLHGDAGPLSVAQIEYVSNIYSSNERMIVLVNSLLNITRIESGRIIVDPVPTDLRKLVESIVTELTPKIKEKKHNLVISVHEQLPLVSIDTRLVREVYLNLITNAIKYTPEKGEVSIFISKKGDEIVSQISDSGVGIPAEERTLIFQKFFRAHNAVKMEPDGTGLGLYLAKAIVDSSGGKIWLDSKEGQGTSFWFTLPLSGTPAKKGEVTINS